MPKDKKTDPTFRRVTSRLSKRCKTGKVGNFIDFTFIFRFLGGWTSFCCLSWTFLRWLNDLLYFFFWEDWTFVTFIFWEDWTFSCISFSRGLNILLHLFFERIQLFVAFIKHFVAGLKLLDVQIPNGLTFMVTIGRPNLHRLDVMKM